MAEEERDRKWTVLRLRGLRKRWIVNTILPVLVLLMLLVTELLPQVVLLVLPPR